MRYYLSLIVIMPIKTEILLKISENIQLFYENLIIKLVLPFLTDLTNISP